MSRSGGGLRSLAALMPRLAKSAIGKENLAAATLLADWPIIAGAEIAAHALPERLDFKRGEHTGGTLHLRVEGGWALALQHLEPQLVERVNASFGYGAVARIRLHQGPLPKQAGRQPPPREPPKVEPAARQALAAEVAKIEQPGLRLAVERLGLALLSQPEKAPATGAGKSPS